MNELHPGDTCQITAQGIIESIDEERVLVTVHGVSVPMLASGVQPVQPTSNDSEKFLNILMHTPFYLNGRKVTVHDDGNDAYGMRNIRLETERDEVNLSFPSHATKE